MLTFFCYYLNFSQILKMILIELKIFQLIKNHKVK